MITRRDFLKTAMVTGTGLAAMGLVGCSSSSSTSSSSEEETVSESSQTDETTSSSEAEETEEVEVTSLTLTVWSPSEDQDSEYGAWLNTMCEQFNEEHPEWDITFEYGVCTESNAKSLVPQDLDAAADVFIFSSTGLENLCETNSLAEFGGSYLETIQANYAEVLVQGLTYSDGGVYGVPMTTNTYFVYYDKSVFSEEDVTSLDAMLEKGKVAIPMTNGFYNAAFFLGAGATFFGEDGTDREAGIVLNTEDCLAMTNYMIDMVANDNLVIAEPSDAISMMEAGEVDAYWCGTWQSAQTQELLGDDFGVAPLPSVNVDGEDVQLLAFCSSKAVGVKSTTEHPEVAIPLAIYLGGYDSQRYHYESRGYVPCYTSLLEEDEIQADEVVAVDAYTNAYIGYPRASFTEMSYFWDPAESFGMELRDGVITHDNAAEKLATFEESVNSSGVE